MEVRYKVVDKYTRCSAIVKDEHYQLRYFKDTVVEAPADTLGIMVFRRRYQAVKFISILPSLYPPMIIIRVEPLSRGKTPKYISRWINNYNKWALASFYERSYINKKFTKNFNSFPTSVRPPIKGTLCYDYVRVID